MNSVEIHSIVLVCYIWLGLIFIIFHHDHVIFGSIQLMYFVRLFPLKSAASLFLCFSLQASHDTRIMLEVAIISRQPLSRSWWHHKCTRVSSTLDPQLSVCWSLLLLTVTMWELPCYHYMYGFLDGRVFLN